MKKIASLILALLLLACGSGCSAKTDNAGVEIKLNGETKNLVAYNIKDNNYFKLRDIANLLKGTEAEFDVVWNESKQAIELLSNTPYSTEEALTSEIIKNPVAKSSYVPIFKDGATVLLGAYNIADNNYFKLRDVASAINFGVDWNEAEGIIEINTSKDYEYPTSSTFGLNTQYLSLMGKTKAEIDKMLGNGKYSWEWGMSTYSNNLMIGWNSLGEEPTDHANAVSMYIPLDKLFFNCPSAVSKDQIKSLFSSSKEEYNEMDGESVLMVNYCGKVLAFYPDYGLSSSSSAFINIMTNYENPDVESIQITNSANNTATTPTQFTGIDTGYSSYKALISSKRREFIEINAFDIKEHELYYRLADLDNDGKDELAVRLGFGIGIYKENNGTVYQLYYNLIDASSYWSYMGPEYYVVSGADRCYIYDGENYYIYSNGELEKANKTGKPIYLEYLAPDELK